VAARSGLGKKKKGRTSERPRPAPSPQDSCPDVVDTLRERSFSVKPKYRYRTDISLASLRHGLRIDVEVDGEFKNNDAEIRKKIEKRNQWFLGNGWHVLRIHSQMCVVSPERVADDILKYYEQMQCEHVFILADVLGERKWRILNKKFAKGLLR
jgi:alkanesulfonate monooxygenase SsuD/methylene tetrahydromethanopterin reductase-like flavin-dependent oxidoreductase (luciferase family)